ncbi:type 1 glutamine amidotransferase [Rhizobium sp. TRM95111]|uniref:type 1 glutamine amidotransferase n=1 Tax=Rhizobium alarense TaxID=2846851 RepID=UPI001F3F9951|nr:type 1 glutamine amidotransferase [Rhizobium alarense]MCF3638972.1 type 1 glutamine amidotransferase [Rhizobium alarense]
MRILVIENNAATNLGLVGKALDEAGATIDLRRPFESQPLPVDETDHDALIVLGGPQSAVDDAAHPYLPDVVRLLRRFGDADRSVLGICLGSQLLARAYGGVNIIGTAPEFGWQRIETTAEGRSDRLLADLGTTFTSFQWHGDTFELPPGALRLCTGSIVANQAFRVGRAAYGTQFHFEAGRDTVARWTDAFPDAVEAMEPGWRKRHAERAGRHGPEADAAGLSIARAWVSTVRASSSGVEAVAACA